MTETLRCVAIVQLTRAKRYPPWEDDEGTIGECSEPIRLREGCAFANARGERCGWDEAPNVDGGLHYQPGFPAHQHERGYEHVSGDRGHEARAPQEVRA